MKTLVRKIVTRTYDDEFKLRLRKLVRDIIILFALLLIMYKVESYTKGIAIYLFEVYYKLDILLFYFLSFIFILTSSLLLLDVRNLMDIATRFVITRFPRMNGDFGPGKRIFRNIVQILLLFLIFYPISVVIIDVHFTLFQIDIALLSVVSMLFVVLTFMFIYDILIQTLRVISPHYRQLRKIIKFDSLEDKEIK